MTTSHYRAALVAAAIGATAAAGCSGSADAAPLDAEPAAPDLHVELAHAEAAYWVVVRADGDTLYAARVGRAKATCADGAVRDACRVDQVDLARLDLLGADAELARARVADGTAIVRGKLVAADRTSTLVVSGVWTREAAARTWSGQRTAPDRVFRLADVHEACDPSCAACAWLRAEPLGGGPVTEAKTLELSLVGGALDDTARAALASGDLLARGDAVGSSFVAGGLFVPFPRGARALPMDDRGAPLR